MDHKTELQKSQEAELLFWKEQAAKAYKKAVDLQLKVDRYREALKEYRAASEFLSASGDNIADYYPEEFEFMKETT